MPSQIGAVSINPQLRRKLLRAKAKPENVYALKVVGDAFEPTAHDGDFAMISPDAPLQCGKFVAIWPKGEVNGGKPALFCLATLPMDGWDKPQHPDSEVEPIILVKTNAKAKKARVIRTELLSKIHRVVAWYTPEPGEAA